MSSYNNNIDLENMIPAVPEFRRMQIGAAPAMPKAISAVSPSKISQVVTPQTPSCPQWKVIASSIPLLDDFYPLEKTHVMVVVPKEEVQTVAQRISQQFVSPSIATTFDENSCTVLLEDGTELVVQLFWDSGTQKLVVECQRTQGCGFTFRQLANTTLRAAAGIPVTAPPPRQAPPPPVPQAAAVSQEEEAFKLALQLIQNDRVDARELGCQSLLQLTNTVTTISDQQSQDIMKQLLVLDICLRTFTLQILGNLLQKKAAIDLPEELMESLERDARTSQDPFTADQATRCLKALRPSEAPAMPPPRPVF